MTEQQNPVANIHVTISFVIPIADLAHYDAETPEQAVENLKLWYADGSASAIEDALTTDTPQIEVRLHDQ